MEHAGQCGLLVTVALVIGLPLTTRARFERGWARIAPGLSESEARTALGPPDWRARIGIIGAGGIEVTRLSYDRGDWTYNLDLDYTGPGGGAQIFRMNKGPRAQYIRWPSWLPGIRVKAG